MWATALSAGIAVDRIWPRAPDCSLSVLMMWRRYSIASLSSAAPAGEVRIASVPITPSSRDISEISRGRSPIARKDDAHRLRWASSRSILLLLIAENIVAAFASQSRLQLGAGRVLAAGLRELGELRAVRGELL